MSYVRDPKIRRNITPANSIQPNCPLANGKYCIKNHCSGNRTLHVTPNKPGVNNVIGTCDAGSTWDVEYLSDGVYKICLSGGHGVVLDLKESAREAGTPIITYPFCKTPNQKWIITAYCGYVFPDIDICWIQNCLIIF